MPAPNHEIAWMWHGNTPKILDSVVEIGRTCVRVGETRRLINLVHQVRTVGLMLNPLSLLPCRVDDFSAFVDIHKPHSRRTIVRRRNYSTRAHECRDHTKISK